MSILCLVTSGQMNAENTFYSPIGFAIIKPNQWTFLLTDEMQHKLGSPRITDQELQRIMQTSGNRVLVIISRYQEPYAGLNPVVQIELLHLGGFRGNSASEFLSGIVQRMSHRATVVEGVHETQIGDSKAAAARITGTLTTKDGKKVNYLTRMRAVTRGPFVFYIRMSGTLEGPDNCELEFQKILASITIEK